MMALPPGCKVTYSVWLDIDKLNTNMFEWFELVGGGTKHDKHYDSRGREIVVPYVRYGTGKWCHHHQNGAGGTRLHFMGKDVSVASMFLLKFNEHVTNHNMQEAMARYQKEISNNVL